MRSLSPACFAWYASTHLRVYADHAGTRCHYEFGATKVSVARYSPSSRVRIWVPPCMTGPSRSFSSASCIVIVPVREYPAPMTWSFREGSVGIEGTPPILVAVEASRKMLLLFIG